MTIKHYYINIDYLYYLSDNTTVIFVIVTRTVMLDGQTIGKKNKTIYNGRVVGIELRRK